MQVCVPSTPAQMFHMLRRQMVRPLRKPLIVMTPKSLLRHPLSVSRLEELGTGGFNPVIDEIDDLKPSAVTRIVLCSGKVYFDLLKSRRDVKAESVAVVRLEQLYPFPSDEYEAILRKYANACEIVWCQEEPQNQGSWYQIRHRLQSKLSAKHVLLYAGRAGAAAPATGISALHEQQQKSLVTTALQGAPPEETFRQTMRLPAAQTRTGS
jgi:2-oxoglutarate dehydrogenase E1 component